MKKTAVECLEQQIKDTFYVAEASEMAKRFEGIFEQAKEMEKEQIKMCCIKTMETCNSDMNELGCKTMDDYFNYIYKETFKSK